MKNIHSRFLQRRLACLFVCDIQEKLFSAMAPAFQNEMEKNVPVLLQAARRLDLPVFVTEQYPKGLGKTIAPVKKHFGDARIFEKKVFAATEENAFNNALRASERQQVIVCGMESHVCVYQTVLGLLQQGYDVHVVADAIGSRTEDNCDIGLVLMSEAGAIISSVETVLFQLLERTGTPEFKELQKLIM